MRHLRIVVIGGGAAGIFGAIASAHNNHDAEITLLEKSHKFLSKVKISGGGRCNVTHSCHENHQLVKNYPRGSKELKEAFNLFSVKHTIDWFERRGVELKVESDGRMFPVSDNSQSIIDCLIKEARVNGVKLLGEFGVKEIEVRETASSRFLIKLRAGESIVADKILIATGGNPNDDSYNWLKQLGHKILRPVPSLFTFNVPNSRLNGLQGLSVKMATVRVAGSNFEEQGPLLITHWGFSGPCILRLSAWGARHLSDLNYQFNISIKWVPEYNEDTLREFFIQFKDENPKKLVVSNPLFEIPRRLWERIALLSGIEEEVRWLDLPKKSMNKLIEELLRSNFSVKGKTTFKEEFVTCGGVSLSEINIQTMESKVCKGIYFAGEVLDIDGITGGFNFQAAWTTGYIAGKSMATSE